jgi:hypothetical protein
MKNQTVTFVLDNIEYVDVTSDNIHTNMSVIFPADTESGFEQGTIKDFNKRYMQVCSIDRASWYVGNYGKVKVRKDFVEIQEEISNESIKKKWPIVHVVKSWSMFFADILSGDRTSDIRLNDRRYQAGDQMLLKEYDPVKQEYTGREQLVTITYMQQNKSNPCAISRDALKDGYVVLSIKLA